jgi:uncharacterized protein (DUF1778 family)
LRALARTWRILAGGIAGVIDLQEPSFRAVAHKAGFLKQMYSKKVLREGMEETKQDRLDFIRNGLSPKAEMADTLDVFLDLQNNQRSRADAELGYHQYLANVTDFDKLRGWRAREISGKGRSSVSAAKWSEMQENTQLLQNEAGAAAADLLLYQRLVELSPELAQHRGVALLEADVERVEKAAKKAPRKKKSGEPKQALMRPVRVQGDPEVRRKAFAHKTALKNGANGEGRSKSYKSNIRANPPTSQASTCTLVKSDAGGGYYGADGRSPL